MDEDIPNGTHDFHRIDPDVAKVEDAVDPRHRGGSCSHIPRILDNEGDAASSTFLQGKKMTNLPDSWNSLSVNSSNGCREGKKSSYHCF